MRIGVDLDEVIVEFVRGYLRLFNKKYNRNVRFGDISSYNLWIPLGISREEAFELADEYYESEDFDDIKLVEGARDGLMRLAQDPKYQVVIVTSRPVHVREKTQLFFRQNFNGLDIEVIYSGDIFKKQGKTKAEICRELGLDFLIEDRRDYALECAAKGTRVLLLDKPWNQSGGFHDKMKRVVGWRGILEQINGYKRQNEYPRIFQGN